MLGRQVWVGLVSKALLVEIIILLLSLLGPVKPGLISCHEFLILNGIAISTLTSISIYEYVTHLSHTKIIYFIYILVIIFYI